MGEEASYVVITMSSLVRNSQHGEQMYVDFEVVVPLELFKGPRCCREYMKNNVNTFQRKIMYMHKIALFLYRPLPDFILDPIFLHGCQTNLGVAWEGHYMYTRHQISHLSYASRTHLSERGGK